MRRRDFIKTASKTAAALTLGVGLGHSMSCGNKKPGAARGNKPNIVFLVADNLGWRDLGCLGNSDVITPNLDRLAGQGIRFTNAFVTASTCSPSRASLITGQYPHSNGVNGLTHVHKRFMLSPFHTTLAEVLSDCGYTTAIGGKWHVAPYLPTGWYGYQRRLSGIFPKDFRIVSTAKALEFLEANRDRPFYLELNFMDTHRDNFGEYHFAEGFPIDPETINVPEDYALPNWPEIRLELAQYYSNLAKMDMMIGEVLAKLEALKLTKNTLVCFVSDNGAQFPGGIMSLYDRGIGTPLVMRWPERIPAGGMSDALVSTIDIMPTFLEAAGCGIPKSVQGRSLLPLTGEADGSAARQAVFAEMTYHVDYLPMRAARTRKWKYIRNYSDDPIGLDMLAHKEWAQQLCEAPNQPWLLPRQPEELYDIENDPCEQVNLVAIPEYGEPLEAMRTLLDGHMRETDDPFLGKEFEKNYAGKDLSSPGKKRYF